MVAKGIDAHYLQNQGLTHSIRFKHGNVTDQDLNAFIPAFNGYAPKGYGNTICLELKGSAVSNEAIVRFRDAVPNCDVIP